MKRLIIPKQIAAPKIKKTTFEIIINTPRLKRKPRKSVTFASGAPSFFTITFKA